MTDMTQTARAIVLFGATGDLSMRMLWPSLCALMQDGLLPEKLKLIGAARSALSRDEFCRDVAQAIKVSSLDPKPSDEIIATFIERVGYLSVDATNPDSLRAINAELEGSEGKGLIFYLATGPSQFKPICDALRDAGLVDADSKLVVEKPLGTDLASARTINAGLGAVFAEKQIYRIDHYLGKETVQNLMALRFGNSIFEPLWNRNAIEQVQITVAETVGVGSRWPYFNEVGALRDMVQNHILQLLCLVAMEPPIEFEPSAVRDEKVKVLHALRPMTPGNVGVDTVIGQYISGQIDGATVNGYREEPSALPNSTTETFVAIRAEIDNWRWSGVPFYLRTGKRMHERMTEIVIQFRSLPHNIFPGASAQFESNQLLIRLQPEERITLTVMNKRPGLEGMEFLPVPLNLSLTDQFAGERRRIAYERLILDVIRGSSALFVRNDELEAAWKWIDGIREGWRATGMKPMPYVAGSWGPRAAMEMPARHGHSWNE